MRISYAQYLAAAGHQFAAEDDWLVAHLREAIDALEKLVDRSALIVLRYDVGGTVSDEELTASLRITPDWLH